MPGYGFGVHQAAAMQAAAAQAVGWNHNGPPPFMGQPQQYPNFYQMAQQQQNFAQQQVGALKYTATSARQS